MIKSNLDLLYSRPAMYLATYDREFDAASIFINFLFALFDSMELGYPSHVDLSAAGPYFIATATGCHLDMADESVTLPQLFDIADSQRPTDSSSLTFLRPIVWFTECCLVGCVTSGRVYQQAFVYGSPQGKIATVEASNEPPRISFNFTLPATVFKETVLSLSRLKRVISSWHTRDFARALPADAKAPTLHLNWCKQAEHYYSLRISPESQPS